MKIRYFCNFLAAFLAIGFAPFAHAQVEDFRQNFALALAGESHGYTLGVSPTSTDFSQEIRYLPNVVGVSGFEFSIYRVTLSYKTSVARNPDDDRKKGQTDYQDFRGSISLGSDGQWYLSGYHNTFVGMYIENSSAVNPSYATNDSFIKSPYLGVYSTGGSAIYTWQPKQFSLAAAYSQSRRQSASGGSFITLVGAERSYFASGPPIIPTESQSQYGPEALINSGEFSTLSVAGGYGYTAVLGNFFATLVGAVGPGYQWRKYSVGGTEFNSSRNTVKYFAGTAVGYNGDTFFSSVSFAVNANEFNTDYTRFRSQFMTLRFGLGFRF